MTIEGAALVLAPGFFASEHAKTAHGLVRGTDRYRVVGVLDATQPAGGDAGVTLDGRARGVPFFASVGEALRSADAPDTLVVGIAVPGGRLPESVRAPLLEGARAGLTLVNGLHDLLADDPELRAAAAASGARLVDVRAPKPRAELHFWTGAIARVRAPRLAVLGTDVALGKRTTARRLVEACRRADLHAEMIYTGQTGWLQGGRYGFVLDSTLNDFVAGELEHAIVSCDRETHPDVIVIEGQSSLRNPSGPCGAELIVSGQARGVIVQHAPARRTYKGLPDWPIAPLQEELALIALFGARVLAVALNEQGLTDAQAEAARQELQAVLRVPVVRPLRDDAETGIAALLPLVRAFVRADPPTP